MLLPTFDKSLPIYESLSLSSRFSIPDHAVDVAHSPESLFCRLNGFVVVEVTGAVDVEWIDRGNAYICNAQTIKVYGEGQRTEQCPWTFLLDWHGKFYASGIRYQVQIGGTTAFRATGEGFVRARGKGYCTVNGNKIQLAPEFQKVCFG